MKYDRRESDSPIVPEKQPNKAKRGDKAAEVVEGRGLAKGNLVQQTGSAHSSGMPCNWCWIGYGR